MIPTPRTFLLIISGCLLLLGACKKETKFTYKATCKECRISYYDEKANFVSKELHQGSFEKEISVADFSPVMIAVQSVAYPDSGASAPIFLTDIVTTTLFRDGKQVGGDTSTTGKKFQAASCSYNWQK